MKKLLDMNDYELISHFEDKIIMSRIERINDRNKLVNEVKKMITKGLSYRQISSLLHLDRRTIKKYEDDRFQFTIENTSHHNSNSCEQYYNEIQKMINENYQVKEIYKYIVTQGYQGKYGLVRRVVEEMKKTGHFQYKVVLSRKYIIKLLYQQLKSSYEINKEKLLYFINCQKLVTYLIL